MALAKIRPVQAEQRYYELLIQLQDPEEHTRSLNELRESVAHYERTYNLQSHRIHQAIDQGELVETLDVCQWILLYNLLTRVEKR